MPIKNEMMLMELNSNVAAILAVDSKTIFDQEDVASMKVKDGSSPMVPWGAQNNLPDLMLEKIRNSDVMSPNMLFNILTAYGNGFQMKTADGNAVADAKVKYFFKRNNSTKYLLEQFTDLKHFSFSVCLLILTNDGKSIARLKHKDAFHARFAENNKKNGKIETVFFANWADNPKGEDVQAYPLLDEEDPAFDLMVRMGIEPDPATGKKRTATKDRIFAIVTRIPIPGFKYYPFPYYASHFNSGWYDISAMIPLAKKAKMENGMKIKYHVEVHQEYFTKLFEDENISDPEKKKERRMKEFNNIRDFLSGIENQGKVWYSGYYIDPNGKENRMIRINLVDSTKEGGDYIEDSEEASNMQCYSMSVHPSLIGAVPGKSGKSLSGTDKRELFTMKQAMEKPFRDMILIPYQIIQEFNKWPEDIVFDIPHMMLTTLDEGKDAKEVSTVNTENNDNNNN